MQKIETHITFVPGFMSIKEFESTFFFYNPQIWQMKSPILSTKDQWLITENNPLIGTNIETYKDSIIRIKKEVPFDSFDFEKTPFVYCEAHMNVYVASFNVQKLIEVTDAHHCRVSKNILGNPIKYCVTYRNYKNLNFDPIEFCKNDLDDFLTTENIIKEVCISDTNPDLDKNWI